MTFKSMMCVCKLLTATVLPGVCKKKKKEEEKVGWQKRARDKSVFTEDLTCFLVNAMLIYC